LGIIKENNMSISIASSAVLIDLNISVWTARKLDKNVSKEIDVNKTQPSRQVIITNISLQVQTN
jgi:hypothetical protein